MKKPNKVSQRDKASIRKSKKWNQLRIDVAEKFNHKDPITGEPLRTGWNLHHVDQNPDHYADFTLDSPAGIPRFLPLNRTTHEMIHSFYRSMTRKKNPRDMESFFKNMLRRLKEMSAINSED